MKYNVIIFFVFFMSISCKESSETTQLDGDKVEVYLTDNTRGWNAADIEIRSFKDKGECSIVDGKVLYKRIDFNYSGKDYCVDSPLVNPENPDPYGCSFEVYEIDFSEEIPILEAQFKGDPC